MEAARVIDITEVDQKIEKKALQVIDIRSGIAVVDNDTLALADDLKKRCRQVIKLIDDDYQPLAKSAFDHHRDITARWNAKKKPYQEFEAEVTKQVKKYLAECKRREEEEAERLRIEAQKAAEEEQLARAAEAEAAGNMDEADEILESEPVYVAPVPVFTTPKVDGRLYRVQTKVRVTNRTDFLRNYCATDSACRAFMELLNEQAWQGIEAGLARKAKSLGKAFSMKGCEVVES